MPALQAKIDRTDPIFTELSDRITAAVKRFDKLPMMDEAIARVKSAVEVVASRGERTAAELQEIAPKCHAELAEAVRAVQEERRTAEQAVRVDMIDAIEVSFLTPLSLLFLP